MLPRLCVVTNDDVVARADFREIALDIMSAAGAGIAFHLRSKHATAAALHAHAAALAPVARSTGALLFVNDRIDIALATVADGTTGVQLGARSIPLPRARAMIARSSTAATTGAATAAADLLLGYSAHSVREARTAEADGADSVILGTIWASASHPGECTAGVEALARVTEQVAVPVYAIGGVTPVRAQEALLAGAHGVAVISAIWSEADPARAVRTFLEAMQVMT